MGTKNNPAARGAANNGKTFDGKVVKPVLYNGRQIGHGKYIAAQFEDGTLATNDNDEQPVQWDAI